MQCVSSGLNNDNVNTQTIAQYIMILNSALKI